jgi:integrase
MALRAGLRQGELIAVKWGDIQFGASEGIPIGTSLCSTTTCAGNLRRPRTRKCEG